MEVTKVAISKDTFLSFSGLVGESRYSGKEFSINMPVSRQIYKTSKFLDSPIELGNDVVHYRITTQLNEDLERKMVTVISNEAET